jgi:hypothetical protein
METRATNNKLRLKIADGSPRHPCSIFRKQRVYARAQLDFTTSLLNQLAQLASHGMVINDAFLRDMDRTNARGMGFDFLDLLPSQFPETD